MIGPVCHAAVEQDGRQQQKLNFRARVAGILSDTELWVDVATKRLVRQKTTIEVTRDRLRSITDVIYRYDPTISIVPPK